MTLTKTLIAILLIGVTLIATKGINMPLVAMPISSLNDTGYLALINRQYPLLKEINQNDIISAWPAVPVGFIDGMQLHSSALSAVAIMFDAAREDGLSGMFVSSGFRDIELQRNLYANTSNKAFVLPPGHSEHHTGLAVDIMAAGVSQAAFGNSEQGLWLAENSYRFGLILRYPDGAQNITKVEFEPWHFRYVGKPHAYFMQRHDLVLEQYINLLQNQGSISFTMNGTRYFILFQTPKNGVIYVPQGLSFTLSNDNAGGYIITAWKGGR